MNISDCLKRCFTQIPIFGGLGQTTVDDHKEALREWFISLLISTAPIWGGTLVLYISQTSAQNPAAYWECFGSIIQNGELFIYAASTLAPVIYIVTRDRTGVRSFPSKYLFIGIVIAVALLSAIIFTVQRLHGYPFPNKILTLSMYIYVFCNSLLFCPGIQQHTTCRSRHAYAQGRGELL